MGEPQLLCQIAKTRLHLRMGIGVDQRDGSGVDPGRARRLARRPGARLVKGLDLLAADTDAPGDLHHARVQRRRLADLEVE